MFFLLKYLIDFENSKVILIVKISIIKYCLSTSHSHPILLSSPDSRVCILPYFFVETCKYTHGCVGFPLCLLKLDYIVQYLLFWN